MAPGRVVACRADVTCDADARAMVTAAVEAFGGSTSSSTTPGARSQAPIDRLAEDDFEGCSGPTSRASSCARRAALAELRRSRGAVVNLGSTVVSRPAARALRVRGQQGRGGGDEPALALDLGRDGIRVNTIRPGIIPSELRGPTEEDERARFAAASPSASRHCPPSATLRRGRGDRLAVRRRRSVGDRDRDRRRRRVRPGGGRCRLTDAGVDEPTTMDRVPLWLASSITVVVSLPFGLWLWRLQPATVGRLHRVGRVLPARRASGRAAHDHPGLPHRGRRCDARSRPRTRSWNARSPTPCCQPGRRGGVRLVLRRVLHPHLRDALDGPDADGDPAVLQRHLDDARRPVHRRVRDARSARTSTRRCSRSSPASGPRWPACSAPVSAGSTWRSCSPDRHPPQHSTARTSASEPPPRHGNGWGSGRDDDLDRAAGPVVECRQGLGVVGQARIGG